MFDDPAGEIGALSLSAPVTNDTIRLEHDQPNVGVYPFGNIPASRTTLAGTCDNVLSLDSAGTLLYCPDRTAHPVAPPVP